MRHSLHEVVDVANVLNVSIGPLGQRLIRIVYEGVGGTAFNRCKLRSRTSLCAVQDRRLYLLNRIFATYFERLTGRSDFFERYLAVKSVARIDLLA